MLRKLLGVAAVSSLVVAGTFGAANAADMRMPLKAPPPPPTYSWTGCYIDGGVGYGMWNQQVYGETFPGGVPLTATATNGGDGWLGRVGGGCDYQFGLGGLGDFVIGAFADYDFMDLRSNNFAEVSGLGGTQKESGAWYAGGRLGYLVTPSLLTYVDAGYTETRVDSTTLFSTLAFPPISAAAFLPSETYHGWFLGGGYEYALNMSWMPIHGLFWRTEYRFAEYQAQNVPIVLTSGAATTAGEHSQYDVQTVTSGLVWRFNWTR
jgi:outer membrane immunogenic protein